MIEPILTEDIEVCEKCNYHFLQYIISYKKNLLLTEAEKRKVMKQEFTFYFYAMGRYN